MSQKKHKGNHGQRAEMRTSARTSGEEALLRPASLGKPRRVYLRNPLYIGLTMLVIVAVVAMIIGFEWLGLWDNPIGSVLSVLLGAFGCMCAYDIFLLMTASVAFGEGLINAGKDKDGKPMIFHADAVVRIEVRDTVGTVLPEGKTIYKKALLTFVMESGRVNQKEVARLTQVQIQKIRAAAEAEKQK